MYDPDTLTIMSAMSTYQEYYCLDGSKTTGLKLAMCECSDTQKLRYEDGRITTEDKKNRAMRISGTASDGLHHVEIAEL